MKVILRSRHRQRRQARRHLRGVRRLRPQLPAAEGLRHGGHRRRRRPGRVHAAGPRPARRRRTARRPKRWPARSCPRSSPSRPRPVPRVACSARSPPPTSWRPWRPRPASCSIAASSSLGEPIKTPRHALGAGQAAPRRRVPGDGRGRRPPAACRRLSTALLRSPGRAGAAGTVPRVGGIIHSAAHSDGPVHNVHRVAPLASAHARSRRRWRRHGIRGQRPRSPRRDGRGACPPHNLDAEEIAPRRAPAVRDAVTAVAEIGHHRLRLLQAGAPARLRGRPRCWPAWSSRSTCVTVAEELRRNGLLDEIGGPALLLELQAATPAISQRGRYARIVQDTALLRRLIGVAGEIAELGLRASPTTSRRSSTRPSRRCSRSPSTGSSTPRWRSATCCRWP